MKLSFSPSQQSNTPDLMAISAQDTSIWEINECNTGAAIKANLGSSQDLRGAVLGMEWVENRPDLLYEARTDGTAVVWDILKEETTLEIIAHSSEATDISVSPNPSIFCTVGVDGGVHIFDMRTPTKAKKQDQSDEAWIKVEWNKVNEFILALTDVEGNHITIEDTRWPKHPLSKLYNHKSHINGFIWSPISEYYLSYN